MKLFLSCPLIRFNQSPLPPTQIPVLHPVDIQYDLEALEGGKVLGKGNYGVVFKDDSDTLAIKKITSKNELGVWNEICIQQHFSPSPFTPHFHGVLQHSKSPLNVSIVMDSGKTNIADRDTDYVFYQLILALDQLKKYNIVHLDIKPGNIIFNGNQLQLIDFGSAKYIKQAYKMPPLAVGTTLFTAPEVFDQWIDFKADVYSVGVTMYRLITSYYPCGTLIAKMDRKQVPKALKECQIDYSSVPPPVRDLLRKMLAMNIADRISIQDIMKHPIVQHWQVQYDFEKALETSF